jgi:benzil reductase ((S)-benzoin forming)
MEKIVIITGGSRGIGSALCTKYLSEGYKVYSIARSVNQTIKSTGFIQYQFDLSNDSTKDIEKLITNILKENSGASTISLINNAGTLGEVKEAGSLEFDDIERTFKINTLIPIFLTNLFIKKTQSWDAVKSVINISSGASIHPIEGWSIYGATKSAIDMFTKVAGKEQVSLDSPIHVYSFYPGKVDTNMQEEIRKLSKEDFKNVNQFIEFKHQGALNSPINVAKKIFQLLHGTMIENGSIVKI